MLRHRSSRDGSVAIAKFRDDPAHERANERAKRADARADDDLERPKIVRGGIGRRLNRNAEQDDGRYGSANDRNALPESRRATTMRQSGGRDEHAEFRSVECTRQIELAVRDEHVRHADSERAHAETESWNPFRADRHMDESSIYRFAASYGSGESPVIYVQLGRRW